MLILTRRVNESLILGDDIRIVVTAIKGSEVRIGIEAPKDVVIVREELLENSEKE